MNWSKFSLVIFAVLASLSLAIPVAAQAGKWVGLESKAPEVVSEQQIIEIVENSKAAANLSQYDAEYQDTEFGGLVYNEASVPTRIEILSLLSKDTPSMLVFMHAISMGLGIDDVLVAATQYEPSKGREFVQSAINLLPLLSESADYFYTSYRLEDLYGEDEKNDQQPYTIKAVAERFFEHREILVPYADWPEGQYHFEASATELLEYASSEENLPWYYDETSTSSVGRPIFVSMYEADQAIHIDNLAEINRLIELNGADSKVPIVVIYNRLNELPVQQLPLHKHEYPLTLRGVQQAYSENSIMLTPAPEWQESEYHIKSKMEEIYEVFDIPAEEDFEPEHWQQLLAVARGYGTASPSFLVIVLPSSDNHNYFTSWREISSEQQLALNDPRAEEAFPYVTSDNNWRDRQGDGDQPYQYNYKNDPLDLSSILTEGLVLNRPDLIAALNDTGVEEARMAFYYIDPARTKPFINGPGALRAIAIGAGVPPGNFGGDGGFGPPPETPVVCASPPCNN